MAEFGEPLSERELEVLRCVASGAANKEIAASLHISGNTVKVHLRNVYTKLGVSSRTEATTVALAQGILQIPGAETAVSPSTDPLLSPKPLDESEKIPEMGVEPESRGWHWVIFLAAAVVIAGSIFGYRALNERSAATPQPFEETRLGDTQWVSSLPLPVEQAGMAVAGVGLDLYQIGGETSEGVVGSVRVYHTTEHTWQAAASKPTAVADATAAVLYGEIYVPGGRLANGEPTDVLEVFSPANKAWRPARALPKPISAGLVMTDGSFLYLFGGWDGTHPLDSAFVYDPGSDSWRPLPPMKQARAFAAGAAISTHLYVTGGFADDSELGSCAFFDTVEESWTACPDMLIARGGAGAAVILNKLYVFGGGMAPGNAITFSEFYDPNTETWQVVNMPPQAGSGSNSWTHAGVGNIESRIYLLGGRRDGELISDNLVYAPFVYQTFIPAASVGGSNN